MEQAGEKQEGEAAEDEKKEGEAAEDEKKEDQPETEGESNGGKNGFIIIIIIITLFGNAGYKLACFLMAL